MTEPTTPTTPKRRRRPFDPGWGPRLFLGVLAAVLLFFWWLLIWSGGVDPRHG